jgi:hypothetical protein
LEDDLRLVDVGITGEDWLSLEHLSKDASSAPHIYCWGISAQL